MVILRKIDTPQDVFILGDLEINNVKDDFLITDDECGFTLASGDNTYGIGSFGGCIILTKEELIANLDNIDFDSYEDIFGDNSILLPDFSGEISLKVIMDNGQEVLNPENFDKTDYVYHADYGDEHLSIDDVIVDIGPNRKVVQFEISEALVKGLIRNEKIDSILKD